MQVVKIVNLIPREQVRTLPFGQINRKKGLEIGPTHQGSRSAFGTVLGNVTPNVGGDHSRIVRASGFKIGPHVMVK